jgi:putative ABC transport system permease protein
MAGRIPDTVVDALRWLRKSPRFVVPSVASLALGVGGTAVMFAVVYAVLLRPLPYREPERLAVLWLRDVRTGSYARTTTSDFNDWKQRSRVFESMGLFLPLAQPITVTGGDYPERIQYQYATASMFELLGVRPQIGRTFADKTTRDLASIVLSDRLWRRRFGADPGVIGKTVVLGGTNYEVLGVMPPGFHIAHIDTDVWRETDPTLPVLNDRVVRWLVGVGRLKPGVTFEQAQADMSTIARQLEEEYPKTNKGWGVAVERLDELNATGLRQLLYPMFVAVGFVLLLACINVAGLLIAQSAGRRKELATRVALGATRGDLARQLVAECTVLALVAGAVSTLITRWGLALLMSTAPSRYEFVRRSSLDLAVFLFALGISLAAGVIIGLIVAYRSSSLDVNAALKENASALTSGSRQRALSVLAAVQIAFAFVLLAGAGLLLRTVANLTYQPLGIDKSNVLTAEIDLAGPRYVGTLSRRDVAMRPISPNVTLFYDQLVDRLKRLPTVESAGVTNFLPMTHTGSGRRDRAFTILGRSDPGPGPTPNALCSAVTSGFFSTLRVPLVRGRLIEDRDTESTPWVVVINRSMAEKFWPNDDPIGKSILFDIVQEERPREIVGIVDSFRQLEPARPPLPEMYVAMAQQPAIFPGFAAQNRFRMSVLMRAKPSAALVADLRRTTAQLDATQALFQIRTMDEVVADFNAPTRFLAVLLALFAGVGTLLAGLGVFALVSCATTDRALEFSIRLAMGATPKTVLRALLSRSALLAIGGIAAGLLLTVWLTRFLQFLLYGVRPLDPISFTVAGFVLVGAALCASLQPARRLLRLDAAARLRL